MKRIADIKRATLAGLMALMLGLVNISPASAGQLSLVDAPLFLDLGLPPNVILTYDDSGSMGWSYIPDDICSEYAKKRVKSSTYNALYYDPAVTYTPGVDKDGNSLGNSSFTGAWEHGYTKAGGTRDLSTNYEAPWENGSNQSSCRNSYGNDIGGGDTAPGPTTQAYYYRFDNLTGDSNIKNDANYTLIIVGSAADTGGTTVAEKQQNFANWYSYYRSRKLTAMGAAGRAFSKDAIPDNRIRLAYQRINTCNTGLGLAPTAACPGTIVKALKDDASVGLSTRTDFFTWLYAAGNSGGTPLREGAKRAGDYLSTSDVNSPWAEFPGTLKGTEFSCRENYHIAFTDGMWSGSSGVGGNPDNTATTFPDGQTYTPGAANQMIYRDSNTDYLADAGFKYWAEDARPDLPDDVAAHIADPSGSAQEVYFNPLNDPATWQHMVQFTVSMGIQGALVYPTDYNDLLTGAKNWNAGDHADDLWHTAINGRGKYLNAQNPNSLATAFSAALNEVLSRTSSGASVALNSGQLDANSRIYQGRFDSGDWTGELLAYGLDAVTGALVMPELWDAGALLTTQVASSGWNTTRTVLTYDGSAGVAFRWNNLTTAMQDDLKKNNQGGLDNVSKGKARLDYLRGDDTDEGSGNNYRVRPGKLGDIVNSSPAYIAAPPFNYPNYLESSGEKYSTFIAAHTSRAPMLYVGANDGMLHGFDATTGEEKLAYIPKAVFPNLSRLTWVPYSHRFFVDGSPTVGDAFDGSNWHTMLVGGLRRGGQAIYALDVTDPTTFSESGSNPANIVKWEYTDADLGYTFARPAIVRMHTDTWAAVFGNGYNNSEADGSASTTGTAMLFVVDLFNGSLIRKIDTGAGTAASPNGLATASPVDIDGDRTIDYVYGGDLLGNMWKFDLTDSDPNNWTATKLFTATDAGGTPQPITTAPEVGRHPLAASGKPGFVIYFGTGKYIEAGDNITASVQTQTFWAIWDPDSGSVPPYARSKLLKQEILKEDTVTINGVSADVRITSDNTITWAANPASPSAGEHLGWYMDLVNTEGGNTDNKGERQVTVPTLRDGRIIFTTLIPTGSSCVFGGDGWIMELDAADGSRLGKAPFDIDGDGVFDLVDMGGGTFVPPGGLKSTGGAPSAPSILDTGNGTEYKYVSGTDSGDIQIVTEQGPPPGPTFGTRESWYQLR